VLYALSSLPKFYLLGKEVTPMQNAFVKKRIGAVIGTLTFLVLIALFVCLPNTSYGATIGSEKPNIYCTYTYKNFWRKPYNIHQVLFTFNHF
jgi:hypothetical protein